MMVFRDTNTGSWPAKIQSQQRTQKQSHGGTKLEKPKFNWDPQDRYTVLLNFELKVRNILQPKAYEISNEEDVPVIKNWLGEESLFTIKSFKQDERRHLKS